MAVNVSLARQFELFENIRKPLYDSDRDSKHASKNKEERAGAPPDKVNDHLDNFVKEAVGERPDEGTLDTLETLHATLLNNKIDGDDGANLEIARQAALIEWLYSRAACQIVDTQRAKSKFLSKEYFEAKNLNDRCTKIFKDMQKAREKAKLGEPVEKNKFWGKKHYIYNPATGEIAENKDENASLLKRCLEGFIGLIDASIDKNKTVEGKWGFFFARGFRMAAWGLIGKPLGWLYKKFFGPLNALNDRQAIAMLGRKAARSKDAFLLKNPDGSTIPFAQSKEKLDEMEKEKKKKEEEEKLKQEKQQREQKQKERKQQQKEAEKRQYEEYKKLPQTEKNQIIIDYNEVAELIEKKWDQYEYALSRPDVENNEDVRDIIKNHPETLKNVPTGSQGAQKRQEFMQDVKEFYKDLEAGKPGTKIVDINAYIPLAFKEKRQKKQ